MPSGPLAVRVLVVLLAIAAAACGPSPTPVPELDTTARRIDELHARMLAVVEAQQAAEPGLSAAMALTRDVETMVGALRSPETIEAARAQITPVRDRLDGLAIDELRPPILAIAFAVDDARTALATARAGLQDPTDRAYLDAEDDVLQAVRGYAQAADELAQVLADAWPAYEAAVARTVAFVESPEVHRDAEEASDAYEVRIRDVLDDLEAASHRIARFSDAREQAARAVNVASAVATERWQQRSPVDPAAESP